MKHRSLGPPVARLSASATKSAGEISPNGVPFGGLFENGNVGIGNVGIDGVDGNIGIGNVGIGYGGQRLEVAAPPVVTRYVGQVYEEEGSRKTDFIFLGATRVASLSNGEIMYYHADHLGGTNVLTDKTGLVRELTEYDPFGSISKHEKYGSDFATAWYYFTGKPLDDETGLMYYGARYYNPKLGRFITPDTIVQSPGNPQTLNRYTYCNNNPVNLTDPTGHKWKWKNFWKSIVKAVEVVLDVVTIAVGVVTGNPFLVASGSLALFNTATSGYQGKDWNTAHQIIGYTSIALAVAGAFNTPGTPPSAELGSDSATGEYVGTIELRKIVVTKTAARAAQMAQLGRDVSGAFAAAQTAVQVAAAVVQQSALGVVRTAEIVTNYAQVGGLGLMLVPVPQVAAVGATVAGVSGIFGTGFGVAEGFMTGNYGKIIMTGFGGVAGWGAGRAALRVSGLAGAKFNWGASRYYASETGRFVTNITGKAAMGLEKATDGLNTAAFKFFSDDQ